MIKIYNVVKNYGNFEAVNIETLEVPKGKIFGFIGPNGAGKTTTIKMIVGLLKPDSGSIHIGDYDINKNPVESKRIFSYIADRPNVYEKLTGKEFITFIAYLYNDKLIKKDLELKIDEYFEIFKMNSKRDSYIQSYSHGMGQKIAIIAALIHEPELIILDEPLVGLDPQGAKILKDILIELVKKNKTVFMSTHILDVAEKICQQIGIINNGRLLFNGSVEDLQKIKGNGSLEDIFIEMTANHINEEN